MRKRQVDFPLGRSTMGCCRRPHSQERLAMANAMLILPPNANFHRFFPLCTNSMEDLLFSASAFWPPLCEDSMVFHHVNAHACMCRA
jgi:hypothetical protein